MMPATNGAGRPDSGATCTAMEPKPFTPDPNLPGLNFSRVLRSELTKLKALRTTWWLGILAVLMTMLITAGVALAFGSFARDVPDEVGREVGASFLAEASLGGSLFVMVLMGALGVIAVTTEFTTGSVRSALTAVPQRSLLVGAKLAALLLVVTAVAVLTQIMGHLIVAVFTQGLGVAEILTEVDVLGMHAAHLAVTLLTATIGFGLGALLRSSAGGIVVLTVIMFVLQIVLQILLGVSQGAEWAELLSNLEYMYFLTEFTQTPSSAELPYWQSGLGLLVWTAVPLTAGWFAFCRRDA